jgi:hypothetical protein
MEHATMDINLVKYLLMGNFLICVSSQDSAPKPTEIFADQNRRAALPTAFAAPPKACKHEGQVCTRMPVVASLRIDAF